MRIANFFNNKSTRERHIHPKTVMKLFIPVSFNQERLYDKIIDINSRSPWVDDEHGRENINVIIEIYEGSKEAGACHPESVQYDPEYIKVTISHGCYRLFRETQLRAYKNYAANLGNMISFALSSSQISVRTTVETTEVVFRCNGA